ncbi:MAG TPA: glycosyltransferase family 4 protein [Burkholderiales bacterium]|nr:glycosyltransferase family 4 protein [Burkholderiales bacterium]
MSGPRIALVRQKYNPAGGAERFVGRAMQELSHRGAQVTLITRQWNREPGQAVVELKPWYLGSTWRDWGFANAVCRHQAHASYDLVQSHERLECCDLFRAGDGVHKEWLAQRARGMSPAGRIGVYLNPHHWYLLRAEKHMFESMRLRAVICNSGMVRDEILRHFRIAADKLHVVYNGVDLEVFHPGLRPRLGPAVRRKLGIPEDALIVLHVGSGFERKGVAVLLRALAIAKAPFHLVVVGRDKHEARYRRLADALGVLARVHFAGAQADPRPFYAAADVFAMASLYEPFANASLEALAMGLPIIVSTKSGAAEILESGRTGYVCDALDASAFASAIDAFADGRRRSAAGAAARALAERFSLPAMTRELLELYQRLLQAPAARPI